ncbi:hypothetical protein B7C62_21920 [Kitasatospora albolonga]|uniref:Protease n=1 Tax=Kitasatospora albolonga TaxID=68173 RepID=A0ABC8BWD0_9ACTN|nr:hypothetical protein B7C62_21920 [Kitasatospora albolonga]
MRTAAGSGAEHGGPAHGAAEDPGQAVGVPSAPDPGADLPAGVPWGPPPDAPAPVPVPIDDPATREGDGGMPPDTLPPPIGG